ncbi:MAG: TIGR00341 family protein [Ignavibacteria bacterium]|nr:TIGR00341 family protein [Ignavibacteria bacterium]
MENLLLYSYFDRNSHKQLSQINNKLVNRTLAAFRLFGEREPVEEVIKNIDKGAAFRGTNLWILVFAIFIASLGLNMNSTAVIIGAMLISPLMGPIMGMGLALGISNLSLLKKSFYNFMFAVLVSLAASTLYFLISPINTVQSELLSRTSPTMYDVLIAFFGGLAGILALSSKQKGNVIPGVAIATALMPPLCTAGFGLANWDAAFFFGAFYLFFINTVFIAWATFVTVKLLKFPQKEVSTKVAERRARRLVNIIVFSTLIPSVYFAYKFRQEMDFQNRATRFVNEMTSIEGNYLFGKEIDPKSNRIMLTYGGRGVSPEQKDSLNLRMLSTGLNNAELQIRQGLSVIERKKIEGQIEELKSAVGAKDFVINELILSLDSVRQLEALSAQVLKEARVNFPEVSYITLGMIRSGTGEDTAKSLKVMLETSAEIKNADRKRLVEWLKTRLGHDSIEVGFVEKTENFK